MLFKTILKIMRYLLRFVVSKLAFIWNWLKRLLYIYNYTVFCIFIYLYSICVCTYCFHSGELILLSILLTLGEGHYLQICCHFYMSLKSSIEVWFGQLFFLKYGVFNIDLCFSSALVSLFSMPLIPLFHWVNNCIDVKYILWNLDKK